jgi:hypothetical protein
MFENRMLRRMFESNRAEVTGGWGKLHNEELYTYYAPPYILRMMRRTKHVAHLGNKKCLRNFGRRI